MCVQALKDSPVAMSSESYTNAWGMSMLGAMPGVRREGRYGVRREGRSRAIRRSARGEKPNHTAFGERGEAVPHTAFGERGEAVPYGRSRTPTELPFRALGYPQDRQ